jgi:hypothetical protein
MLNHEALREIVTIVSGLPRSGTSMMMRALDVGGLRAMTDGHRQPDIDNPYGYFEYEPAKRLAEDTSWLAAARGKVVKIVYRLLYYLPSDHQYRIVFMHRDLDEVIASQNAMLRRSGLVVDAHADAGLKRLFAEELARCEAWVDKKPNCRMHRIEHCAVLAEPGRQFRTVCEFLGIEMDIAAMEASVDRGLYRERRS